MEQAFGLEMRLPFLEIGDAPDRQRDRVEPLLRLRASGIQPKFEQGSYARKRQNDPE